MISINSLEDTYPLSTLGHVIELYAEGDRPTEILFHFENIVDYVPCLRRYQRLADPEEKLRIPKRTYVTDLQGALPVIMHAHMTSFLESSEYLTLCLDGTVDSRASKSYGIGIANEKGEFYLLNFVLLTQENGEIIAKVVKGELEATGHYTMFQRKIRYIMSDTSATQLRGNRLLINDLGGNIKTLRCTMHAASVDCEIIIKERFIKKR